MEQASAPVPPGYPLPRFSVFDLPCRTMLPDANRLLAETWINTIECFDELPSTQDRARQAAEQPGLRLPLLVVADRQTAGRGRGSHRWWTGPGSLAFSLLFDPATLAGDGQWTPMLSLAAGVAVVDTVSALAGDHLLGLHWPNDVYVDDRKLAGVLIEVLPNRQHVVGIGINTNNSVTQAPPELRDRLATLSDLSGRVVDHTDLLAVLLDQLRHAFAQVHSCPEQIGSRFDLLCLQHGRMLRLRLGDEVVRGRCAGIASDGSLVLDTDRGRRRFVSGTLH